MRKIEIGSIFGCKTILTVLPNREDTIAKLLTKKPPVLLTVQWLTKQEVIYESAKKILKHPIRMFTNQRFQVQIHIARHVCSIQ